MGETDLGNKGGLHTAAEMGGVGGGVGMLSAEV